MNASAPALTPHQIAALDAVLSLLKTERVVALRGFAGTGKSTVIPHMLERLPHATVAAATNKAAAVLRAKGIADARTFHSVCLKPIMANAWCEMLTWIAAPDAPFPALLRGRISPRAARALIDARIGELGVEGCARSLGVNPKTQVAAWIPRRHEGGVLIIDEASMINTDDVMKALDVFDKIILVGDPGQLPPVTGQGALALAEGVDLTEIHRQAADSAVLRLAMALRAGASLYAVGLKTEIGIDPDAGPIITWRNKSRVDLALTVRHLRGHTAPTVQAGEELVCRATEKAHRERGFFNNAPATFLGNGRVDFGGETLKAEHIHVEEMPDPQRRAGGVPFRLGYAMTCHSAQGSEWPRVQIYQPDLAALSRYAPEVAARWLYTAVTRAGDGVRFFAMPASSARHSPNAI